MSYPVKIATLCLLGMVLCSLAPAAERPIDVAHSSIRIHVGKAGLFSVAGHEHWVRAPIASGSLQESEPAQVSFTVDAGRLMVEPDKTLSDKDQAEVQRTMQEKVLESARYPEISFHSTDVEKIADDKWRVQGELLLHGQSRPVSATVVKKQDEYLGSCRIKQSDFGIRRVSVGGGVVKVKDELEIDFAIAPVGATAERR
ncbi:MAG: YceI family protein [Chlamydiota bacterium]